MFDPTKRYDFLGMAVLFEGSLVAIAALLGRWCSIEPLERFEWSWSAFGQGVAATVPMFVLFLVGYRWPVGGLRRIKQLLAETLGPSLAVCRWYDLLLLAGVAGIGEEVLFRGVLQPWLGMLWSNVLFGLAHSVSPLYALLAAGMGAYLGWLLEATGDILAPIVCHALYDFLAFLVVARDHRAAVEVQSGEPGA